MTINPLQRMVNLLLADLPKTSRAQFDAPANPAVGVSWADVYSGKGHLIIEWHPTRGFGVSDAKHEAGYGEGPESTFPKRQYALAHCRRHFGLAPKRQGPRSKMKVRIQGS